PDVDDQARRSGHLPDLQDREGRCLEAGRSRARRGRGRRRLLARSVQPEPHHRRDGEAARAGAGGNRGRQDQGHRHHGPEVNPLAAPAVELRRIDKRFGDVHANRDVSLAVRPGTIHGIVGENGAGKSTLMGILYGYYQPDRGEILVRGEPTAIRSAQDALAAGIGMVHQHFMLVEPFTVLENVVLGAEGGLRLERALARARATLARLGREYHLEVDPDARVAELSVGQRQRVEILKALYRGAGVLILDEPTAVLTPAEADHLFRILVSLRDEGKAVLLITHKLREIRAVTDVVTVMRQGRIVATLPTAETTAEQLAELMGGRGAALRADKAPAGPGEPLLEVTDLVVEDARGAERVKRVSFTVCRGEIVGVAGVAGNGQAELLEALAGMRPAKAGQIRVHGGRLGHVPED